MVVSTDDSRVKREISGKYGMKFGEKLRSEIVPEWSSLYLDYDKLKNMIKELEAYHLYDTQITDKG